MEYSQKPQEWQEQLLYSQNGNARQWFAVGGDVDDFIFFDNDQLPDDDHDPRSCR